ncbi:hypothetical protein [Lagierella sp.]|uniref:hypothetical protein n=1 Tax=Lagierella sp. TaxID=2849657 RepID=UPI00260B1024|nr:hypothetical protein [Lagierella sp.]
MKKEIKLRNVIFPIWMLWVLPITWLAIIPINAIIDGLVLLFTTAHLSIGDKKNLILRILPKTVLVGFISDIIASIPLVLLSVIWSPDTSTKIGKWWLENISPIQINPLDNIFSFLIVLACVILGGFLIYFLNRKFVYKNIELTECEKFVLARNMAIFTAPYLFLIPLNWF